MIKITPQVVRCYGLLRSSEFAPLLEYWTQEYAETLDMLTTANSDMVPALQGKARFLKAQLDNISNNEKLVAKFKASNPNL